MPQKLGSMALNTNMHFICNSSASTMRTHLVCPRRMLACKSVVATSGACGDTRDLKLHCKNRCMRISDTGSWAIVPVLAVRRKPMMIPEVSNCCVTRRWKSSQGKPFICRCVNCLGNKLEQFQHCCGLAVCHGNFYIAEAPSPCRSAQTLHWLILTVSLAQNIEIAVSLDSTPV